MRFKSKKTAAGQVFAVCGVNTISFAVDASAGTRKGLLGFAVERIDPAKNQRYFMPGFKVFREIIPHPDANTQVSTHEHPVQSLSWDDFTAEPDHEYRYLFYPLKGKAKNLDRSATPMSIRVRTEPLFSAKEHDVFFNRGVASSQAYRRRFGNKKPDEQPTKAKEKEALDWLSRQLDDAILRFIRNAGKKDALLCCFYEFHYKPVTDELKDAIQRGVDVRLIVDAKRNKESFPRDVNLEQTAGFSDSRVFPREARPSDIQHNKFMVLLKGAARKPTEVWTGSTNISEGGIMGQTNVGHWVRNAGIAASYRDYWDILAQDPGARKGDGSSASKQKNKAFKSTVEQLGAVPTSVSQIPSGVTTVFSPRSDLTALDLYVRLVDSASDVACITLAFGINKAFKDALKDNTPFSHLVFLLLEKKDKPTKKNVQSFVKINASNNVYKAWGAYIRDPLYQWARETNALKLGLNKHVIYVHSKFLLMDPLGDDPIVVTGSANFSEASTEDNDENMLIIRGDKRVADIYFTEFNRLFNHYYFRAVLEDLKGAGKPPDNDSIFLVDADTWLKKYAPGKLKTKRLNVYTKVKGASVL